MACLKDIKKLFGPSTTPFYAGFGNRITDAISYRSVEVPSSRIFTIDPTGEIKLELVNGYKSSYLKLNDIVDQIFPPVEFVGLGNESSFNDFAFWREQLPVVEITVEELKTGQESGSGANKGGKGKEGLLKPKRVVRRKKQKPVGGPRRGSASSGSTSEKNEGGVDDDLEDEDVEVFSEAEEGEEEFDEEDYSTGDEDSEFYDEEGEGDEDEGEEEVGDEEEDEEARQIADLAERVKEVRVQPY
jgi:hypothetical protein